MIRNSVARLVFLLALVTSAGSFHSASAAHAAVDSPVGNAEMPLLEGGKAFPLRDVEANVLVFFRVNQKHSVEALSELAKCKTAFTEKSVHWVAIVSGSAPAESVTAMLRDTGFVAPVLVDRDDAFYGSLGVAMHPVVVLVGRNHKLAAFETFRAVDFCSVVSTRIRYMLHEISDTDRDAALAPPKATQGGGNQVARRYRAFAEVLFRDKNYDNALQRVRKSLELDPGFASSHELLGQILSAQGKCAEAIPAFNQALAINASSVSAKEGLARCKPAR